MAKLTKIFHSLYEPFFFSSIKIKKIHNHAIPSVLDDVFEKIDMGHGIQYYGIIPRSGTRTAQKCGNSEIASIGIVVQGQIDYKDNFTLESLRLYRSQYPKNIIILSTWTGEVNNKFRAECMKLNIHIIESSLPDNEGFCHVNCQIYNSYIGAKSMENDENIRYVLKTRTNQRIYKPDFLRYLLNVFRVYSTNKNRIVFLDSSYLYIPFYLCDYLSFGEKKDIINLYDIPFEAGECDAFKANIKVNRQYVTKERKSENISFKEFNSTKRKEVTQRLGRLMVPEIYIAFNYFKKHFAPDSTYTDSMIFEKYWDFVRNNTIIIDERDLLLYWPKYKYRSHRDINCYFYGHGLNHAKWLDIYVNGKGEE